MDSKKWLAFMEKANEELLEKKEIDFGSAFIALIIQPSFHNHFRVLSIGMIKKKMLFGKN
jgi:hypothetical protein